MRYVRWFNDVESANVALVGGKNASLARMIQDLSSDYVHIPHGFAITTDAYWMLLDTNQLRPQLAALLAQLPVEAKKNEIAQVGVKIRELIAHATVPQEICHEIEQAYSVLSQQYDYVDLPVAVRSSASAEDLPTASFAGQQDSFLHIQGAHKVVATYQRCCASLFTDRAITYRMSMGFDHMQVALSVGVQKMVMSSNAVSGVAFSLDVQTGFDKVVLIEAAYGLGEGIVKGAVIPDSYVVYKRESPNGILPILNKQLGAKSLKVVYRHGQVDSISVPAKQQELFCLGDATIEQLARAVIEIELFYDMPMDVEWAVDEHDQQLYIVQARPETVHAQHLSKESFLKSYRVVLPESATALVHGVAIGRQAYTGTARVIMDPQNAFINDGDIIVTTMSSPDWLPILKQSGGIITELGGRTCHAAIVARELGIPAVVGAADATNSISSGDTITIDCTQGQRATIYDTAATIAIENKSLAEVDPAMKQRIMISLSDPEQAFALSSLPVAGVGLIRLEFVVAHQVGIHPLALLYHDRIEDKSLVDRIEAASRAYKSPASFYRDRLTYAIATIAAAFYPRPITIRCTDFKSNEYRKLLGGDLFEQKEENPTLGFRGVVRYLDEQFNKAFRLECEAISHVVNAMAFDTITLLVPFVRTIPEAAQVRKLLEEYQLDKCASIQMMVEVPSNVIELASFSEYFDGFSIGSNDLTQLVLGVDRDSAKIAHLFSETNSALYSCYRCVIEYGKQHQMPVGFCGQGPSDDNAFMQWLLRQGIDTVSLTPDAVRSIFIA